MLIGGIVTGIAGFITVCFGIGLYRCPVKNEDGEPVLDDDYDQVYEETVIGNANLTLAFGSRCNALNEFLVPGNAVLTVGIVIMILSLFFLCGGLLAKCLEPAAKRVHQRS